MIRYCVSILMLPLISGCGIQALTLNDPVVAHVARKPENTFGGSSIILRSYKVNDEKKRVEFSDAKCSGRNALVSFSRVTTPAHITLPTYLQAERFSNHGKPPPIKVSCKYGKKVIKFDLNPTSSTNNVTTASGGQYNPQTGVYSNPSVTQLTSQLSSTLPWRYSSAEIDF